MTQDKSTPRPWEFWSRPRDGRWFGPKPLIVGCVLGDRDDPGTQANAALIVQAVNSHDALQECVEAARKLLKSTETLSKMDALLELDDEMDDLAIALAKLEKGNG